MRTLSAALARGLRRWGFGPAARAFERLARGESATLPRIYTIGPVFGLFAVAGVAGLIQGEGGVRLVENASFTLNRVLHGAGFAISKITMHGLVELEDWRVMEALDMDETRSLPAFDADAARRALERAPWVREATILKLYPNALQVSIVESRPRAVWQMNQKKFIVDDRGRVLEPYEEGRFDGLPLVAGEGAAETADALLDALDALPEARALTKAATRIGGRRWTIRTQSDADVKLPEHGLADALIRFADLERASGHAWSDIESVDLRLRGRTAIRLRPEKRSGS